MSLYIIGILACLLGSAFFSASEMSYSSCNRIRLEHMAENGSTTAAVAVRILEHFDDALSAILVGNNLVNIASSSLSSVVAILAFGPRSAWIATVIITLAVIIFGETIPKITAQKNATRFADEFALPVHALMILFTPVTRLVVGIVDLLTRGLKGDQSSDSDTAVEELHSIIETAEDEDVLDEDEVELISAAIDFSEITAQEVMTARVDLLAIDFDDSWQEIMEIIEESPYSRIPVYEDSIDNIIGILSMNHLLKTLIDHEIVDIRKLLLPAMYVYKTMKLPAILSGFRSARQHLAIVTDEYGGTLGVVSMEDVMEALVGDIWDETDTVETDVVEKADGVYEIDGDTVTGDLVELMGWDEDEFDFISDTVGGWCIEMLDGFPEQGDSFEYMGSEVCVLEVDERRVTRVQIRRSSSEDENRS